MTYVGDAHSDRLRALYARAASEWFGSCLDDASVAEAYGLLGER